MTVDIGVAWLTAGYSTQPRARPGALLHPSPGIKNMSNSVHPEPGPAPPDPDADPAIMLASLAPLLARLAHDLQSQTPRGGGTPAISSNGHGLGLVHDKDLVVGEKSGGLRGGLAGMLKALWASWASATSLSGFLVVNGAKETSTMIKARFATWLIVSPLLLTTSYPVLAGGGVPQVCADGTPGWLTLGIHVSAALSAMLSLVTILLIILLSAYLDMVSAADTDKPWQTLLSGMLFEQLSEHMSKDSKAFEDMLGKKSCFDAALKTQIDCFLNEEKILTNYWGTFGHVTAFFILSIVSFACMVSFTLACVFSKTAGMVLGTCMALLAFYYLVYSIIWLFLIVPHHWAAVKLIDARKDMRDEMLQACDVLFKPGMQEQQRLRRHSFGGGGGMHPGWA